MRRPENDDRSPEQRIKDEQIAARPVIAPLDLPATAPIALMESYLPGDHLGRARRSCGRFDSALRRLRSSSRQGNFVLAADFLQGVGGDFEEVGTGFSMRMPGEFQMGLE